MIIFLPDGLNSFFTERDSEKSGAHQCSAFSVDIAQKAAMRRLCSHEPAYGGRRKYRNVPSDPGVI